MIWKFLKINPTKKQVFMSYLLLYGLIFLILALMYPLVFTIAVTIFAIVIILDPIISLFRRFKGISRLIADIMALSVFFAAVVALVFFLVPSLVKEAGSFYSIISRFFEGKEWEKLLTDYPEAAKNITDVLTSIQPKLLELFSTMINFISKVTPQAVSFIFYVTLGAIYSVYYFPIFKDRIVYIFPKEVRGEAYSFLGKAYSQIRRYVFSIFMVGIIVGIIFFFFLQALGSKYAVLLGCWATFTNLIPIVGVVLEAIPLIILGFSQGLNTAIIIIIGLFVVHPVAFVIFLRFMKGYIQINPVVIIFLIPFTGQIFGFLGALIAVPVGILFKVFWESFVSPHLEKKRSFPENGVNNDRELRG